MPNTDAPKTTLIDSSTEGDVQKTQYDGAIVMNPLAGWWGIVVGLFDDYYVVAIQNKEKGAIGRIPPDDLPLFIRKDLDRVKIDD